MPTQLILHLPNGRIRPHALEGARACVGRSEANELSFPDDAELSRHHLAFEVSGSGWTVTDLGSKNGTYVNGRRLTRPHLLSPGDLVTAGRLSIEFEPAAAQESKDVLFIEEREELQDATMVTNLSQALTDSGPAAEAERSRHVNALVRAGRELAMHRPLEELFGIILDLAVESVNASRGVLLTQESGGVVTRAARGAGFRISNAVLARVFEHKEALLVRDAQIHEAFKSSMSIVQQQVRSMMAVPLQAEDRVIGLLYVDTPQRLAPFTRHDLNLLTVLANVAAVRLEHARLLQVEQAEQLMARELEQAAEIQQRLLPGGPPAAPGFEFAGYNAPCRSVGGDYYDFFEYPDGRIGLLVADVAGKGMPAALMVSGLHARIQTLAGECPDLATMVSRLNRGIHKTAPANRFVTLFVCLLDPATGGLTYCNAGHNPPLILHEDGSYTMPGGGGLPLGLFGEAAYEEAAADLAHGETLAIYSDGVSEAPDPSGREEFGERRMAEALHAYRSAPARDMIQSVIGAVERWSEGAPPADDITLVVAKRL